MIPVNLQRAIDDLASPTLLSSVQAARRLGVRPDEICDWVARGILGGQRVGGRVVVPAAALARFQLAGVERARPFPDPDSPPNV